MNQRKNMSIEAIEKELKKQVEITVKYCEANREYSDWNDKFFKKALQALSAGNGKSTTTRIADACNHLQVFGGMCSWTDVGGSSPNISALYDIYTKANNLP